MALIRWCSDAPRFTLTYGHDGYPEQLSCSPDPPKVLYGIGDPSALRPGVAMVGARRATPYGLTCIRRFATWAAGAGYAVVSGAAVGCDQAAHEGALDATGTTVAVLGCGADIEYPSGSGTLLSRIVASGGAVVSELPWGFPPQRWAFRRRNRIIAGLSAALVVVEAGLPSGTFSTAEYALDAGRDVLAVPGSILAPECAGPNRLIRQGATPLTDVSDLAIELERLLGPPKIAVRTIDADPSSDPLFSALRTQPLRPDDAARLLGTDIISVIRQIGALEAEGLIARFRDGRYGAVCTNAARSTGTMQLTHDELETRDPP